MVSWVLLMAEVLIYGHVPKEYIKEIIVTSNTAEKILEKSNIDIPVTVNNWLFFDFKEEN